MPIDNAPVHGPTRRPGDVRREAIRERVALQRELNAMTGAFDDAYPDIFAIKDEDIPF